MILEGLQAPTVFKDEGKLDLGYVPPRLPHREEQYRFLTQVFRCMIDSPGVMSPRAMITGGVGTGKTVLTQRFGSDLERVAREKKGVNLHYIHVNCHELRGSSFLILTDIVTHFIPHFPRRGFSSEEALRNLMNMLDEENAYVVLALDETEALIHNEGSAPLYNLTRIHETRLNKPQRLALICILRNPEVLARLDAPTLSTLQRNFIRLPVYGRGELIDIINYRASLAIKEEAILSESLTLIADICSSKGDARYAIELLLRSGKCADNEGARYILPEHVRKAQQTLEYPPIMLDYIRSISLHERLFLLAVARSLGKQPERAYAAIGEVEETYRVLCEEHGETPRGHTQLWKYMNTLSVSGLISTQPSGRGQRGKTTNIGLPMSAIYLEKALVGGLKEGIHGAS